MPELPEVETVRRQLDKQLAGATILAVEVWRSGREFPAS
jgi:formamidopyrimidine-DNA glycosylase